MPRIHLTTFIAAPVGRVFDLSRSIDLHRHSMSRYGEAPVAGKKTGLVQSGDFVTWKAKHLFIQRQLTVRITHFRKPLVFTDEQVKGDFKLMKHEHYFKPCDNGTIMIDQFYFESPYNMVGRLFNRLDLTKYMQRLLEERNRMIKQAAETAQWKQFIN